VEGVLRATGDNEDMASLSLAVVRELDWIVFILLRLCIFIVCVSIKLLELFFLVGVCGVWVWFVWSFVFIGLPGEALLLILGLFSGQVL